MFSVKYLVFNIAFLFRPSGELSTEVSQNTRDFSSQYENFSSQYEKLEGKKDKNQVVSFL